LLLLLLLLLLVPACVQAQEQCRVLAGRGWPAAKVGRAAESSQTLTANFA